MIYALISMFLIVFLTEVINLPDSTLWWVGAVIVFARVFDAINDPIMGTIVDNTKSKWGKFKPWITGGTIVSGFLTILLFADFGLEGAAFVILFFFLYIAWGIAWTANDIAYWSMLPALSINQTERENMGAFARICANIGLFAVVVGVVPLTKALGDSFGGIEMGYLVFVIIAVVIMWIGQAVTVFGVKQPETLFAKQESTPLKELFGVIVKNDQLLYLAIAMSIFMIGYVTTTSFGVYFFKYAYGNEDTYSLFALVLGVSQLSALALFPVFSKRFTRGQLFSFGTILVVLGYVIFFFAPMNMLIIGPAGILLFVGQAFIQLLMLMFLADTIEYGQWKLGRRNESITFSLQPFINKMGGAIASGVVLVTLILSGINEAETVADVTEGGILTLKIMMMIFPLILIVFSYFMYKKTYKIDDKFFAKIIKELKERGEISE
jgi:melibiose permease/lactose/raffinose/galactose permease